MTTTRLPLMARGLAIAALAIGAAALAPAPAEAHLRAGGIAPRIDRIADDVRRVRDIRSPYRRDAAIDRLQYRLERLEAINDHRHGRGARRNDARIDRLQHRLHRMERRAEARIAERERWHDHHDHWHGDRWDDSRRTGWAFGAWGD